MDRFERPAGGILTYSQWRINGLEHERLVLSKYGFNPGIIIRDCLVVAGGLSGTCLIISLSHIPSSVEAFQDPSLIVA